MSIFNIFNRHPRGDISAQADGELAPERRQTLEAHLAGCERCRTELDDLLSLRSALSSLPQVAAPRSFTLTPAMAEREPRPVTSRAAPSFVAMRVAGAGFAAVLAVVVMLDAGGIVDDTGGGSDESSAAILEDDLANRGLEADGYTEFDNLVPPQGAGGDNSLPATGDNTDAFGGVGGAPNSDDDIGLPATSVGGSYGEGDGQDAIESVPEPDAPGTARDNPAQEPIDITTTTDDAEKALTPESGDGAPTALAAEDDGTSSLLLVEIGLAALAVLAIGGSFVIRRRAESE